MGQSVSRNKREYTLQRLEAKKIPARKMPDIPAFLFLPPKAKAFQISALGG